MSGRSARPTRRVRRLSTEDAESDSDGWAPQNDETAALSSAAAQTATGRTRRGAAIAATTSIYKTSLNETGQSMNLTVKAAPSKLKKATTGRSDASTRRGAPRGGRTKRPMVETESDDEDATGEDDADGEVDEDEVMVDADADADADEDAEGEEVDEMSEAPTPPVSRAIATARAIKPQKPTQLNKTTLAESARTTGDAAEDDDDDELSDLDDEDDDDAEGEDDDEEEVGVGQDDDDDDDQDELDSDATPASGSRALTPDLSKLTRRQRATFEEIGGDGGGLLALSNEAQKKKVFTAEETAMRRAEMARRRKNLSEKRNEEEKMDTINRLLKKQAPKRRGRAAEVAVAEEEEAEQKPSAVFVRWINNAQGSTVVVPEEWLGQPAGELFEKPVAAFSKSGPMRRMVEEID